MEIQMKFLASEGIMKQKMKFDVLKQVSQCTLELNEPFLKFTPDGFVYNQRGQMLTMIFETVPCEVFVLTQQTIDHKVASICLEHEL